MRAGSDVRPIPGWVYVAVVPFASILVYLAIAWTYEWEQDGPLLTQGIWEIVRQTIAVHLVSFILWTGIVIAATATSYRLRRRIHATNAALLEEQRHALRLEQAANEVLRTVDGRKDDFVSTVSHEFRTPLTGILGFSEMIRDESLTVEEIREYANDIHTDAQRLARMINDMLDLDRIQSGRTELSLEVVDLGRVVRDVADIAQLTATGHNIDVQLDGRIPLLWLDRDRMTQVVTNLVNNAVKYSPEGGNVSVRMALDDDRVCLSVQDSGIGIPTDSLERVFDRFSRVESKAMRDIQGTGLGLPIVRQIAQMHGARVWAESELGKGSTFRFSIPLERARIPATTAVSI